MGALPGGRIANHVPVLLKSKVLIHMTNINPTEYRLIFQQRAAQFSGSILGYEAGSLAA
jgi:hypothetical protein